LLAVATIISPFASAQTVVTGGAGGAYFKFAVPANWNGDLLMWNPGTGNLKVVYGDDLINSTIKRVSPDPNAQQLLADNYTPSGKVRHARIVSLHTDKDGLGLIENETDYSSKVPATNFSLAVALETTPSHCGFSPAEITAGWESLRGWVDGAPQPSATSILGTCQQAMALGIPGPCRFDPGFVLPGVDGRFRPR